MELIKLFLDNGFNIREVSGSLDYDNFRGGNFSDFVNFYIWDKMNFSKSFHRCLIYFSLYIGRLQYDAINASVIEFNEAISGKYNFLQKGFQTF